MIDTLSHIETKPLFPGEFKQTYPENKPATVSWVGIGAIAQAKPSLPSQPQWPPVQSPAQSVLTTPSSVVEANPEPTSPAPALPSNNGNGSPTPETTNAPVASSSPLDALAASSVPASAPVQSSDIASSSTLDESFNIAPSQDVAEDIADALVVKVVDDIPTLDASAQVATTETSQVQPAIAGTVVPGIQGSPDLSSVGLAPPSQFYKVVCPKCGADVPKPAKVWELKGGKSKKNVLIGLFQCQDCRVKFREALTREIL